MTLEQTVKENPHPSMLFLDPMLLTDQIMSITSEAMYSFNTLEGMGLITAEFLASPDLITDRHGNYLGAQVIEFYQNNHAAVPIRKNPRVSTRILANFLGEDPHELIDGLSDLEDSDFVTTSPFMESERVSIDNRIAIGYLSALYQKLKVEQVTNEVVSPSGRQEPVVTLAPSSNPQPELVLVSDTTLDQPDKLIPEYTADPVTVVPEPSPSPEITPLPEPIPEPEIAPIVVTPIPEPALPPELIAEPEVALAPVTVVEELSPSPEPIPELSPLPEPVSDEVTPVVTLTPELTAQPKPVLEVIAEELTSPPGPDTTQEPVDSKDFQYTRYFSLAELVNFGIPLSTLYSNTQNGLVLRVRDNSGVAYVLEAGFAKEVGVPAKEIPPPRKEGEMITDVDEWIKLNPKEFEDNKRKGEEIFKPEKPKPVSRELRRRETTEDVSSTHRTVREDSQVQQEVKSREFKRRPDRIAMQAKQPPHWFAWYANPDDPHDPYDETNWMIDRAFYISEKEWGSNNPINRFTPLDFDYIIESYGGSDTVDTKTALTLANRLLHSMRINIPVSLDLEMLDSEYVLASAENIAANYGFSRQRVSSALERLISVGAARSFTGIRKQFYFVPKPALKAIGDLVNRTTPETEVVESARKIVTQYEQLRFLTHKEFSDTLVSNGLIKKYLDSSKFNVVFNNLDRGIEVPFMGNAFALTQHAIDLVNARYSLELSLDEITECFGVRPLADPIANLRRGNSKRKNEAMNDPTTQLVNAAFNEAGGGRRVLKAGFALEFVDKVKQFYDFTFEEDLATQYVKERVRLEAGVTSDQDLEYATQLILFDSMPLYHRTERWFNAEQVSKSVEINIMIYNQTGVWGCVASGVANIYVGDTRAMQRYGRSVSLERSFDFRNPEEEVDHAREHRDKVMALAQARIVSKYIKQVSKDQPVEFETEQEVQEYLEDILLSTDSNLNATTIAIEYVIRKARSSGVGEFEAGTYHRESLEDELMEYLGFLPIDRDVFVLGADQSYSENHSNTYISQQPSGISDVVSSDPEYTTHDGEEDENKDETVYQRDQSKDEEPSIYQINEVEKDDSPKYDLSDDDLLGEDTKKPYDPDDDDAWKYRTMYDVDEDSNQNSYDSSHNPDSDDPFERGDYVDITTLDI